MLNVKLTIAVLVIVISIYTPILQIEIRKTVSKFERYQIPTITPPALLAPSDNLNPPPPHRSREFRKTRVANSQRRIDLDRSRQSIKTLAGDYFVRLRSRSFIRCPPLMENYSAPLINDRNVVNNKKNYRPHITRVHSRSKVVSR